MEDLIKSGKRLSDVTKVIFYNERVEIFKMDPISETTPLSTDPLLSVVRNDENDVPLNKSDKGLDMDKHSATQIHFGAGVLIQKWCRHQYIKGLVPTILALWAWTLSYVQMYYQEETIDYIRDQLSQYNCTTVSATKVNIEDEGCASIDTSSQYYFSDPNGDLYLRTVSCTLSGVDLYYPNDFFDVYRDNYYLQLVLNFLVPLFFTYFIYEFFILALHDCLVIVPGLHKESQRPILQYATSPYRMGWFGLRSVWRRLHGEENKVLVLGVEKPGIRIGRNTSIATNFVTYSILSTIVTLTSDGKAYSDNRITRCVDVPDSSLDEGHISLYAVLALYLIIALTPTTYYYYQLFFYFKDLELLAYRYSREFMARRYRRIRNPFDLIAMLLFPLPLNVVYYTLVAAPCWIAYSVRRSFSRCCCRGGEARERWERQWEETYQKYYYPYIHPKRRWWSSWFLQVLDDEQMREHDELPLDLKDF